MILVSVRLRGLLAAVIALLAAPASFASTLGFTVGDGSVVLTDAGRPIGEFVHRDPGILRPYVAHLHAPGGIPVTRHHPPRPGQDPVDHDRMHPGVWMAFGDLSGHDFWRNRATIRHERFTDGPAVSDGVVSLTTESALERADGAPVGRMRLVLSLASRPAGYLLVWDATIIASEQDLVFGDQEEMGMGVRVATPLTETNGGTLTGSTGERTAKATWGRAFDWCDYSGRSGERVVGITLMPDPANFRRSWFHNRAYGLMAANPFGRKSMNQGDVSAVRVPKGESLRLRFGVLLHSAPLGEATDLAAAYRDFLAKPSVRH